MCEALPNDWPERIKQLCAEGDERARQAQFYAAVPLYEQALQLLPPVRERGSAATWVYAAIADAYFLAGALPSALGSLKRRHVLPRLADDDIFAAQNPRYAAFILPELHPPAEA